MRSVLSLLYRRCVAYWPLLSAAAFACSAPDSGSATEGANLSGAGGQSGSGLGGAVVAPSSGAGGSLSAGGTAAGVGGTFTGGGAAAGHAGSGGHAVAGMGGAPMAGAHTGGASGDGGSAGSSGGGGASSNAVCQMVKSEYAAELEKQLGCKPNTASQCTNKVAAAPGCECRVFMQPTDPFAIEHLSNLGNGWFEADCSMPSCPAKCSTAAAGTCQADAKSPLGGRCVTP